MQVSVETTGSLGRRMTVALPEQRVAAAIEEQLRSIIKTRRVQGFRPGKLPLRVARQRFGASVREDVIRRLLLESYEEALAREQLRPVGPPSFDPVDARPGQGLSYTVDMEIFPEVSVGPIDKLSIEKPVCAISDSDVDRMIERLRRAKTSEYLSVERAARQGDRLSLRYRLLVDGAVHQECAPDDTPVEVEVGAPWITPECSMQLQGVAAGETRSLTVTFPEGAADSALAGKSGNLEVQVIQVTAPELPPLDADFFRDYGVAEGGEAAFRRELRNHIELEAQTALRARLREAVLTALSEANPVELPQTMVDMEVRALRRGFAATLENRNVAKEVIRQAEASLDLDTPARRRLTQQLLIKELVRARGLTASPERVKALVEARAQGYEAPEKFAEWYYRDKQRLAEVEHIALEDELFEWILSTCKVTESELTFDELMNTGQTDTGAGRPGAAPASADSP